MVSALDLSNSGCGVNKEGNWATGNLTENECQFLN